MLLKTPIKFMQLMVPIQYQRFRSGVEVLKDAPRFGRPDVENCDKIADPNFINYSFINHNCNEPLHL